MTSETQRVEAVSSEPARCYVRGLLLKPKGQKILAVENFSKRLTTLVGGKVFTDNHHDMSKPNHLAQKTTLFFYRHLDLAVNVKPYLIISSKKSKDIFFAAFLEDESLLSNPTLGVKSWRSYANEKFGSSWLDIETFLKITHPVMQIVWKSYLAAQQENFSIIRCVNLGKK